MSRRERQLGLITRQMQRFDAALATDWLDAIRRQVCPFCNEGPFIVVASHVQRMHDVDARQLRYMLGLPAHTTICDPFHSKMRREQALNNPSLRHDDPTRRGPGSRAEDRRPPWRRPWRPGNDRRPEQCPLKLGNVNGYVNFGCRCAACKAANTAHHLSYMHDRPEQYERQRHTETRRRRERGVQPLVKVYPECVADVMELLGVSEASAYKRMRAAYPGRVGDHPEQYARQRAVAEQVL